MGRTSLAKSKAAISPVKGATSLVDPHAPTLFVEQFFFNLLPDDLAHLSPKNRQRMAASIWAFAQDRPRGKAKLRFFNPEEKRDGWAVDHTVLEIVNDDIPFLVDSLTGELQRRGLAVHLSIHPIMCVRRDDKGRVLELQGLKAKSGPENAEAFIHVQFDRCLDPALLRDMESDLCDILVKTRAAVEDWPLMRKRLVDVSEEIRHAQSFLSSEDTQEACAFLQWLDNNKFTFLGYRTLDLEQRGEHLNWKVVPKSGLGLLREEDVRMFGGLRDLASQPDEIKHYLKQQRPIIVTKTNECSSVHRAVPMDAILVQRFDAKGRVVGEHLFIGLFTATTYTCGVREVPYLRKKASAVIARTGFDPEGHNGKVLLHILDDYPRDEMFQIEVDDLLRHSLGIVRLYERASPALFVRRDPFGRFATCLVYVPRERYGSTLRRNLQNLLEVTFAGKIVDFNVRVDNNRLARVFLTIALTPRAVAPDLVALNAALQELCRSWAERLRKSLISAYGAGRALELLRCYGNAFPPMYREATPLEVILRDLQALETVRAEGRLVVDLTLPNATGRVYLRLFQPKSPFVLSEILPLIENMGLKIEYTGGPYEVSSCGDSAAKIYIHEFVGKLKSSPASNTVKSKALFEEAFARVVSGETENDSFNALVLRAGFSWREVTVLRAFAKYLKQLRIPYSSTTIASTLLIHAGVTQDIVALFDVSHNPDYQGDRRKAAATLEDRINAAMAEITVLEDDRILRRYLNLVQAILRTNYYQRGEMGASKPYISFKLDSRTIDFMPLPKPLVEVFVYSPRVEAVHLRGGKVARGGVRWSDRRDDFRNEILGLMKAQMVKNSVIVPTGSKGGFVVKRPPQDPEKFRAEGVACYQIMMRGLLDLTDNRVGDKIVPPSRVVRHDGDDPYLVVAADKGTATFSDIANALARDYGFWLDDAFASGGSVGYDHKKMAITARGVWEAVKRHFREIGRDIQTTDFTCLGVGDMSGDVFGNGMLLSRHTRLVGAFDHRHIFCDPNPEAATSYAERKRMFNLPRSSWADYDRTKISKGGGVFSRSEKLIRLSPEIKRAFGITADSLSPNELIHAMLRAKVDLLYFGGIGTYVKASTETHENAGDRANDVLRANAKDVQALIVGEGANLGMTQRARIEFALKGGRINTDAIDNSAGVDTSDHEVNIKILLRDIVSRGEISLPARNKLLASMTDEVAALVLRDNYLQTQALSVAEAQGVDLLAQHSRLIRTLEKTGLLNRAVEFLPDDAELAERQRIGRGLTRPEMAVLLSYTKIWLYDQILASDLPDDPFMKEILEDYFPAALRKKYAAAIGRHQLRREIIANVLTNDLVNRAGISYLFVTMERTGAKAVDVARARLLVRESFGFGTLWHEIEKLDNRVPATAQTAMLVTLRRTVTHMTPWFLARRERFSKLAPSIATHHEGVARLAAWFVKAPSEIRHLVRNKAEEEWVKQGAPESLARRVAMMPYLATAPDLASLAGETGDKIEEAASVFFGLGQRLSLDLLRERAAVLVREAATLWKREAVVAVLEDMFTSQRALTDTILKTKGRKKENNDKAFEIWVANKAEALERHDALLAEIRASNTLDLAMLTLVSRQLNALAESS